jgi:hypothetical protein
VGPRAGLDVCGKSRPPTGIRSPDRPAGSQSLHRLSYPAHLLSLLVTINQIAQFSGMFYLCEFENYCSPTNSPAIFSIPSSISILLTAGS